MEIRELQARVEWAKEARRAFLNCVDAIDEARERYKGSEGFDATSLMDSSILFHAIEFLGTEDSEDEVREWANDDDLDRDERRAAKAVVELALRFRSVLERLHGRISDDDAAKHWEDTISEALAKADEGEEFSRSQAEACAKEWVEGAELALSLRARIEEKLDGDKEENDELLDALCQATEESDDIGDIRSEAAAAKAAGKALLLAFEAIRRATRKMRREQVEKYAEKIVESLSAVAERGERAQVEETARRWEVVPELTLAWRTRLDEFRAEVATCGDEDDAEDHIHELVFGDAEGNF